MSINAYFFSEYPLIGNQAEEV